MIRKEPLLSVMLHKGKNENFVEGGNKKSNNIFQAPCLLFRYGAFFVPKFRNGGLIMYEPYSSLANAIIIQAAKDYIRTNSPQVKSEIKSFFRSEWFTMLSKVDGETLIRKLEQKRGVKRNGCKEN